jgi:hypothetical protein
MIGLLLCLAPVLEGSSKENIYSTWYS